MPLPTERQLLEVWEEGYGASAAARARALLHLTAAGAAGELDALSLGESERQLLVLRRRLLGRRMSAVADCPDCGERHDVQFDVDQLLALPEAGPTPLHIRHGDLTLVVRPLTLADFEAAAQAGNAIDAADELLESCVLEVSRGDAPIALDTLDDEARDAIGVALAAADPLLELTTEIACAQCGRRWDAALDTAAYLWIELQSWAERLLHEVHTLAAAYGWTEDDVLRLTPWRRAAYSAMAGQA